MVAATGLPGSYAKPGVSLADLAGGTYALAAINAALFARTKTGLGTRIDIALFDVLLEWMSPLLLAELHSGSAPSPAGLRHASIAPYGPYTTADHGMVFVAVQNEPQWVRFCTGVLRAPHIATAPEFESNSRRIDNRARLESLVEHTLSQLSAAELSARLESSDVPYGRLNQVGDVLRHPQAAANDRWSPVRLPELRRHCHRGDLALPAPQGRVTRELQRLLGSASTPRTPRIDWREPLGGTGSRQLMPSSPNWAPQTYTAAVQHPKQPSGTNQGPGLAQSTRRLRRSKPPTRSNHPWSSNGRSPTEAVG